MSIKSGFFNSVNHDRKYTSDDMSEMFNGLFSDGIFYDAVIQDGYENNDRFAVTADSGFHLLIGTGKAWFNKVWILNDSKSGIMIGEPHLILPRIDAVCIQIDKSENAREAKIVVVPGVPAANPVRPTLTIDTTNKFYQYALAYVRVEANATSIAQNKITNVIGTSETPYATYLGQAAVNIKVANNLNITEPGWILDARQGKVLGDRVPFGFGVDNNGRYGYYRTTDNKFIPFLGTDRIVNLGRNTRFDLKSYDDYRQFTVNNFFIKSFRATATAGDCPQFYTPTKNYYDRDLYASAYCLGLTNVWIDPHLSYDADNGILTVLETQYNNVEVPLHLRLWRDVSADPNLRHVFQEDPSARADSNFKMSIKVECTVYLVH